MALPVFVALVSDTAALGVSELTVVAAAIQKQVARDLKQHWDIQGTVSAFARLEDVPAGFWPVIVRDDIEEDAEGTHCDDHGQPLALVTSGPSWSVTASHEVLEMLVDPFGNRTVAGPSPKADQGRVEFLVEVADPVGDSVYAVDGIKVSDFCTPRFFDPQPSAGVQYCATGSIQGPREIQVDGYLDLARPHQQRVVAAVKLRRRGRDRQSGSSLQDGLRPADGYRPAGTAAQGPCEGDRDGRVPRARHRRSAARRLQSRKGRGVAGTHPAHLRRL